MIQAGQDRVHLVFKLVAGWHFAIELAAIDYSNRILGCRPIPVHLFCHHYIKGTLCCTHKLEMRHWRGSILICHDFFKAMKNGSSQWAVAEDNGPTVDVTIISMLNACHPVIVLGVPPGELSQ